MAYKLHNQDKDHELRDLYELKREFLIVFDRNYWIPVLLLHPNRSTREE
jgi:hypothetical protein